MVTADGRDRRPRLAAVESGPGPCRETGETRTGGPCRVTVATELTTKENAAAVATAHVTREGTTFVVTTEKDLRVGVGKTPPIAISPTAATKTCPPPAASEPPPAPGRRPDPPRRAHGGERHRD